VLRGLVRKDRAVALCLTSRKRLLAMQASNRRGWRTELALALSEPLHDESDNGLESGTSEPRYPAGQWSKPPKVGKLRLQPGERVLRLEVGPGGDQRCFALQTVS
jgi:hypothetical protein